MLFTFRGRYDSPAFELLQLAVMQHTPHVLVHLLQIHIETKVFFFSATSKHVGFQQVSLFSSAVDQTLLIPKKRNLHWIWGFL